VDRPTGRHDPHSLSRGRRAANSEHALRSYRALSSLANDNPAELAGFLDVSSGRFTADPTARITGINGEFVRTGGSPALVGWGVGWPYFVPAGRWVSAYPAWVSPDGTSYLYPSFQDASVHVVDARTADDHVVASGRRLLPVQWTADGVYLMDWPMGGPQRLYLLSPTSGRLQPLGAQVDSALPLSGGAAWRSEVAAGIPTRSGQNGPIANSLVRVDLTTGRQVRWFSEANSAVSVLGFATDGSPLVLASSASGTRLLRVTEPSRVADNNPVAILPTAVTDSNGTWMITTDGTLLLYRPGSAPAAVVKGPAGLKPAGACRP
jgi:hypothetical protein